MTKQLFTQGGPLTPGRRFLTSVSTLLASAVLAQGVTFVLSFVLTRLYTPAEFGHYSIFAGTAGALAGAATGAMDRVIVLARSDAEARRAGTVTLVLALACATVVSLVGVLASTLGWAGRLPLSSMDLVLLMPAFMIGYAGAQVLNSSSLRYNRIRLSAGLKVGQSLLMGAVQVGAAPLQSIPGLVIGSLAGWMLLLASGVWLHLRHGLTRRDIAPRALFSVLRRHWRYPCYIMPNELADNLSNQVPILLLGSFMSLSIAGQYGLAITMLSVPAAILGRAVGQAFLQYIARHQGEPLVLRNVMLRVWAGMAAVGILPFGLLIAFGPSMFELAFGSQWAGAGSIAQILSALLFCRFVSSATSTIYLKLQMQAEQSFFVFMAAIYRTGCYSLAIFGIDLTIILISHVFIEILAIVLYNLVALRRLREDSHIIVESGA